MIKLDIHEYCHNCAEFEPLVTQRPGMVQLGFNDCRFCDDTIVECEQRNRCETIYNCLKNDD